MLATQAALALHLALAPAPAPAPAPEGEGDRRRPAEAQAQPEADAEAGSAKPPITRPRSPGLRQWLTRPLHRSARFLDHGVVAVAVAGGTPHRYRLDVRVGVLDVVSIGATAHWLPGQPAPQVWPVGSIALWRGRRFEIGGHYRPVLHPPAPAGVFTPRTHMGLASFVLGDGWFSAGLDVGAAHTRVPVADPSTPDRFQRRTVFAGGVFARAGTRRYGFTADASAVLTPDPLLVFELAVDVRFGAFEARSRGGWRRW